MIRKGIFRPVLSLKSCSSISAQRRHYAMWVEIPFQYGNRSYPRCYDPVSVRLKDKYLNILQEQQPVLFLRHQDFKARDLIRLRSKISSIPSLPIYNDVMAKPSMDPVRLIGVRTSALGVAIRECEYIEEETRRKIKKLVGKGAVFLLTFPTLEPSQIRAVLRILDRSVPPRSGTVTPEESARLKRESEVDFVPGKEQKKRRPNLTPRLEVTCGLIAGRIYTESQVRSIATLPTLQTLQSQVAGLLTASTSKLVGVLSEASGGQLLGTLQTYQNSKERRNTSFPK